MFVHELICQGEPDSLAIVDHERRITYRELQEHVAACRNRLYAAGVRVGDRVSIFSRNSADYIYAYMAIASLGAIAVPINFQLSNREIAEKLYLSEGSVKQYANQIYSKLHIDGDTRTKRKQLAELLGQKP